jgi:hypothetical protein
MCSSRNNFGVLQKSRTDFSMAVALLMRRARGRLTARPLERVPHSTLVLGLSRRNPNAFHLPRRYLDPRRPKHRRAHRRYRGLSGCTRHLSPPANAGLALPSPCGRARE